MKQIGQGRTADVFEYAEVEQWLLPAAAARLTESISREEQDQLLVFIKERLKR